MDRQVVAALAVVVSLQFGCSRSEQVPAAAAAQARSAAGAPTEDALSGGAPQASVNSAPAAIEMPHTSTAIAPSLEESYRRKAELSFSETVVEGALTKPPTARAANPLRADAMPAPSLTATADENPLRAAADTGSMAVPSYSSAARAQPPEPMPARPAIEAASLGSGLFGSVVDGISLPAAVPSAAAPLETGGHDPNESVAPVTAEGQSNRVVQVFYGTDRQPVPPTAASRGPFSRLLPTGCLVVMTLGLMLVAAARRSGLFGALAASAALVTLILGYNAASRTLADVRLAAHQGTRYTSERASSNHVDLGLCEVTIPSSHAVGELEGPSLVRLEIQEDAARHVVLRKTERLADERFYALLRERVQASPQQELFVFIHGFNVSFEDAARRTAQIHHDLEFDGAPVFFSWPAHDKFVLTYAADETNVAWSAPHLKQFLLEIVKESGAKSVNVIAHSMGNRALGAALREIDLELHGHGRIFNQVVLAAPDIDADDFRNNIAPAMQRTAKRLTIYASSRDDALLASQLIHRASRAGDAGEGLVVLSGIDTIDVTAIDSSPWGHAYYGSSDPVLHDLKLLLLTSVPPQDRSWLSPAERDGLTYWVFQPTRTAITDQPAPR